MSSSFIAGGNIAPNRFVTITGDRTVSQSGSGDANVIGVSQNGTRLTPFLGLNDGFAAIANESLQVWTKDDPEAWLQVGASVTAGDFLKPDSNGKGITSSSDGDVFGAKALTGGSTDQIIKVKIMVGFRGA